MQGRVALVQIDKIDENDNPISVVMVEVVSGDKEITITEQPGQPMSEAIRKQAESLIDIVLKENES